MGRLLLGATPCYCQGDCRPATPFSENTKVYRQSEGRAAALPFSIVYVLLFFFCLFCNCCNYYSPCTPNSRGQPPFLIICMITSTGDYYQRKQNNARYIHLIHNFTLSRSAIIHAIAHCINTVTAAERTLPSSRFTVAIAATHGVYSRVNTRNTIAVNGVKSVCICETSPPSNRVRVETTLSFAVRPVMSAVDALQSPKPSGANIGANRLPSIASKLFSALSATLSLMSNVCKNHITIDAAKITVNAFWIKSFAFSHIS